MYKVKEIYYTLQGEGFHTGRPAIFLRFTGCNLWSGREEDRHKAICKFCDTDFWGMDGNLGGKYDANALVEATLSLWPENQQDQQPFVVCTGGEPALQLDQVLVEAFHQAGFAIAIETNGTLALPTGIDWVCVSPKANTEIIVTNGNELKLVFPQVGLEPEMFADMKFDYHYLQPMESPELEDNTWQAIRYCKNHPQWNLSVQMHKVLNIP